MRFIGKSLVHNQRAHKPFFFPLCGCASRWGNRQRLLEGVEANNDGRRHSSEEREDVPTRGVPMLHCLINKRKKFIERNKEKIKHSYQTFCRP